MSNTGERFGGLKEEATLFVSLASTVCTVQHSDVIPKATKKNEYLGRGEGQFLSSAVRFRAVALHLGGGRCMASYQLGEFSSIL